MNTGDRDIRVSAGNQPPRTDFHFKELVSGSSVAFAFKIAGLAAGFAFTLIVTRCLGSEAMGILALSLTMLSIFSIAGRAGLDSAMVRFVAEYASQKHWERVKEVHLKALQITVPLSLVLSVLMYISSPYIASGIFGKAYLAPFFRTVSYAILPMVLLQINAQGMRGLKRIWEFTFVQHTAIFFCALVIMAMVLPFSRSQQAPLISYVAGLVLVSILSLAMWLRASGMRAVTRSHGMRAGTLLSVSLPMLFSSSMYLVMHWTDTIMIGMFMGEADVGIYNVAMKLATLTSITLFAVNSIAAPKFAESFGKNDHEGLAGTVAQSTGLIFWTSAPILLVIFLFPSFLLGLFGREFTSGLHALLILSFGQFVNAASGSVGYFLQMTGRQKVHQNILGIAVVINILLNAVLIPRYGINGAAFASAASVIFWSACAVVYVKSRFNLLTVYVPFLRKA